MIQMNCRDRLGNTLFQYAVGRHLSIKHGTALRLNLSNDWAAREARHAAGSLLNQLGHFNLQAQLVAIKVTAETPEKVSEPLEPRMLFKETKWGYDANVLKLGDNVTLDGYFQSERYFRSIEPVIREDLKWSVDLDDSLSNRLATKIAASHSVSIHVRRRDYLDLESHHICSWAYYSRAMAYFRNLFPDLRFFVFSDDIEACAKHFRLEHCTFVRRPDAEYDPILDFRLMSSCKHHIISNSSFSWWAAWLNPSIDKIVVSPDRWFSLEAERRWEVGTDPILDSWIKISP